MIALILPTLVVIRTFGSVKINERSAWSFIKTADLAHNQNYTRALQCAHMTDASKTHHSTLVRARFGGCQLLARFLMTFAKRGILLSEHV